jgi:hypothetical protein
VIAVSTEVSKRKARRRALGWSEDERKDRWWSFLETLYDMTGGEPYFAVKPAKLRSVLGWDGEAVNVVRDRLASASLIAVERRRARERWERLGVLTPRKPAASDTMIESLRITALGADEDRAHRGSPSAPDHLARTVVNVSGQGHQVMVDSPSSKQSGQWKLDDAAVAKAMASYRQRSIKIRHEWGARPGSGSSLPKRNWQSVNPTPGRFTVALTGCSTWP